MIQRKVLFVDHTAVMGGAELSLLDLATVYSQTSRVLLFEDGPLRYRLEKQGIQVCVAKVSTTLLDFRASGSLRPVTIIPELWNIAGIIAREAMDCDLIIANSQKAFVTSALTALRGGPPIVWYLRDILTAKHFSRVNRTVAIFLANQFTSKVLVNSRATGEAFTVSGGKKELLHVVYNGFESSRFDVLTTQDIEEVRIQLGIGDVPLIGLFSRLSYWKGQHILLEAVKKIPQAHVIVVGDALFGEEKYVSKLKDLANAPQLQGRIHWLGFRNDIPALMKACDIIVHTSTEPEPFGRVIVEGQLAKKPVIASAAGGALELIEDGVNGCLFPSGDVVALRQKIKELFENRFLANKIAQQGYINAKTNFALESILSSFNKAISSV